MRVLVVDHDSNLLTAIAQLLGEYFTIDAVTNKADCLDLVRVNEFDVIVAGERLQDGSGLELLGQLQRIRPDMLRIFAIERERLKLLRGRLGPFGLFRTLGYPIEPRQLLAALSAAAGVEEDVVEVPEAPAPAATSAVVPLPERPTVRSVRDAASTDTNTAAVFASPRRRPSRQPTPQALAVGSRLAAASKAKAFAPPLLESSAKRSAFVVGAGVLLVLSALAVALRVFYPSDNATFSTARLAPQTQTYPPEVLKLVADTETALEHNDFKTARTDIAALQQIAPTHPRLPFLEKLLQQKAAKAGVTASLWHRLSRHSSTPKATASAPSVTAPAAVASFVGRTVEDFSSAGTQQPRVIERVEAEYPLSAAKNGIEGAVDLAFRVSAQGDVRDITVVHSEPANIFNRAAIAAVRQWKYQPKTVNGVPTDARMQLRLTFKRDPSVNK